jgi:AhpD family alkylhydroperoxidase
VWRHHPRIFWTWVLWELGNERALHVLDPALRDLVQHRVAARIGCSWCIDFGTMLSLRAGMSRERITDLDDYATSGRYTDDERAALAYADAMIDTPLTVTDEMVADLADRFGDEALVELTYAVALEQMRSRFNHALGITAQGFTTACAVSSPDSGGRTRR